MPIYEYACAACGRRVEVVHPIAGVGPESCESCGGPMRKALSAPAIVFKGSGWAKKDARRSTSARDAGEDGGAADGKGSDAKGSDPKGSDTRGSDAKGSEGKGAARTGSTSEAGATPSRDAGTPASAAKPAGPGPATD